MIYRGFSIEPEPYAIKGLYYGEAVAIRFFGELVAYADSIPLARRAIDAHMKSGIWPLQTKEAAKQEFCAKTGEARRATGKACSRVKPSEQVAVGSGSE